MLIGKKFMPISNNPLLRFLNTFFFNMYFEVV